MVGGGIGGFIGEIHRMAMRLDDRYELVAGALSSDATRAMESAKELGIRGYATWQELLEQEKGNVDCVVIVTPNDSHAEIATAALQAGYHVVLDKPMTRTLDEAIALSECVANSGKVFGMTYTYTGYPMIRQMRERIQAGDIGNVRTVSVDYRQGWLANQLNKTGKNKPHGELTPGRVGQVLWAILVLTPNNLHVLQQVAQSPTFEVMYTPLLMEDWLTITHVCNLKWNNGVIGDLVCSQVCTGERNHVSIRVWGDKGSLSWSHNQCDELKFTSLDGTETISHCTSNRAPSGHPAGFVEAFANIYTDCANHIQGQDVEVVGIEDGLASMKFIDAVLKSQENQSWSAV